MEESKSREKILKKVRAALIQGVKESPVDIDLESEIYSIPPDPPEEIFARQFTKLNGKFIFCSDAGEFSTAVSALAGEMGWTELFAFDPLVLEMLKGSGVSLCSDATAMARAEAGISTCECLVARTGTVMVSSRMAGGRRLPVYPHYHIVAAFSDQLVMNVRDALKLIREKYKGNLPSMISAITGPSRTADIEKTLVQGAHGPKEIYVFLIDRRP